MDRIITFELSKAELIEIEDATWSHVRLYAFRTGDNSHKVIVDEKVLKECADTIRNKPLVCYFDKYSGDLAGHEPEEVPIGFIPENSKIEFEKDADGETWLCVEALIWKNYSGNVLELFKKSDDEKPVSVEMAVLRSEKEENGIEKVLAFAFFAVTILGTYVAPAVKNARAEIIKYAKDVKKDMAKYNKQIKKAGDTGMEKKEKKFEISFNELWTVLSEAVREEKFVEQEGDEQEEESRYWLSDFCSSYAYCFDDKEGGYKAIPYTMAEDGKPQMNFEGAKEAKRVWMVKGGEGEEEEGSEYSEEADDMRFGNKMKEMEKTIQDKEAEFAATLKDKEMEFTVALQNEKDASDAKISEFTEQISDLQNKINDFTSENEELKTKNNEFQAEKIRAEFERLQEKRTSDISSFSQTIRSDIPNMPESEIKEWIHRAENYTENEEWKKYEDVKVWEVEFKAAAFDYLSKGGKKSETVVPFAIPNLYDGLVKKQNDMWATAKEKYNKD